MNQSRKKIYYKIFVVFLGLVCIFIVLNIQHQKRYFQTQLESKLPQDDAWEDTDAIRVLIKTNGFAQTVHNEVRLKSESGVKVTWIVADETDRTVTETKTEEFEAEQEIVILPSDERFKMGNIWIESKKEGGTLAVTTLKRGCGVPTYQGKLELFQTAEGVAVVNELPLEVYLCAVVPSEMPASYELEALKAQAVCARSYAYNQSRGYSYPEYRAHVDDSVSFQVYANSAMNERTNQAVKETAGEKIWYKSEVATAYYYSTSSGRTASITAWGNEFQEGNKYLQSVEVCNEKGESYEASLPWYRWTINIPEQVLSNLIEMNTATEIGTLLNLTVTQRGDGGIAQEITAVGTTGKVVVETENKIRRVLGGKGYTIEKQDGTVISGSTLLPSAFFSVQKKNGVYTISGGGYGHGIGMSQNGANEMAKEGEKYKEILKTFYTGVEIHR